MESSVAAVAIDNDPRNSSNLSSRKKSSTGGWSTAVFIIFVEMAERFAFYGLAGNLITFLTNDLGEPMSTAAKHVNTWVGVSAIFPFLGAFIADSYLGRFKTILASSVIYFSGMVLLTLSVSVIPLHYREAVFFTALYILAIGEGGHKPCVQTFAADQFDENNPQEKAAKSSFFNWCWAAGFGVLSVSLAASSAVFLAGIKRYRKQGPTRSPFTMLAQVFVATAKKRRVSETHGGRGICYEDDRISGRHDLARTNQFRFLDKAMIIDNKDFMSNTKDPWRLCSLNQVEEVKLVLRLIPIWLACLVFSAVITQINTFFTKQGSTMLRSIGPNFRVPPAALQCIVGLEILVLVPVYDQVFVPMARKIAGHPRGITMLQRIGAGLFVSILSMVVAALVETARVNTANEHSLLDTPKAVVSMSIWWLVLQYILIGLGDCLAVVGLQELFYDQMLGSWELCKHSYNLSGPSHYIKAWE
ncbi:hypothetical protein V6N13_037947 [Hibiscus sabdariffa]|uniref:Uncharacterized protein n=1 Tax=Hibiscus sabdariffa TaxID=183260 RepID=A0ABR2S449_9ROSI